MTTEQLTAYLQDDSYLYAVSYEELKTLVMQYPYATNLRILLLKKSFLEQNKDYDRNLQMAATFTTNRKYLYQVVQKVKSFQSAPQSVILGEDYLELTELSNIEKLLAEKQVADALGSASEFDNLAADWQLEFGNLETPEEANSESKIKGRDEEEIEMFELAFDAQITDSQSVENEEDLNFLIDNIVSEYKVEEEPTFFEEESIFFEEKVTSSRLERDKCIKTPVSPEKSFFDLIEFPVETTVQPVVAIAESTVVLPIIMVEPIVEVIEPMLEQPIMTPEPIVEAVELPIIAPQRSSAKASLPAIDFFELIGQKMAESAKENETKIPDTPFVIVTNNDDFYSENLITVESKSAEMLEAEMDALLSNSFKSVIKDEPDDLMATSFAVIKGVHSDLLEEDLAYSFMDETDIKQAKNEPVVEADSKAEISTVDLASIEADFDNELRYKILVENIESVAVVSIAEEPTKKVVVKPAPIIKRIVSKQGVEAELATKAAIKLEKEITREAPSHSFRVIKKQLANEVAMNTFKVVVKDKASSLEPPVISVPPVIVNEPIELPQESEILPIIEDVAQSEIDEATISTQISNLFAAIEENEAEESTPIFEFVDDVSPIFEESERFADIKTIELIEASKKIEAIKIIEEGFVSIEPTTPPQYIRNLEDILPVFKQKLDNEEKSFEKDYTESKKKTLTQNDDELDDILASFDNKIDKTNEMSAAKKTRVKLNFFKEERVKKAPTPVAETSDDNMSFTEWLKQYRVTQAAAVAQAAAYETHLRETDVDSKVIENQFFMEKEDSRKSIKKKFKCHF